MIGLVMIRLLTATCFIYYNMYVKPVMCPKGRFRLLYIHETPLEI